MTPEYRIDAEQRIEDYLGRNGVGPIKNMQVEKTFDDTGGEIHVWNVRAEDSRWWVVEGESSPMNLYTQDEYYFSADEAYSFHLGITQRLHKKENLEFKHVVNELPLDIDRIRSISRRLNRASIDLNHIQAPEDIQKIGLVCRECLIDLGKSIAEEKSGLLENNDLQAGNFKGITEAAVKIYAPGKSHQRLRKRCKEMAEMAWEYASEVVHSPNRSVPEAKICLLFSCSVVSIFENLYLKYLELDTDLKCSECASMNYVIELQNNDSYAKIICQDCDNEQHVEVVLED